APARAKREPAGRRAARRRRTAVRRRTSVRCRCRPSRTGAQRRMTPSIRRKLAELAERHQEVALLLAQPEVAGDMARFRELSKEYAQLEPVTAALKNYDETGSALAAAQDMLKDAELRELAQSEIAALEQ